MALLISQCYTGLVKNQQGGHHPAAKSRIRGNKDFKPLNEDEQGIIRQAQRILGHSAAIPCTACHYCTDGCPKQIPIPDIFAAANKQLGNGQMAQAKERYAAVTSEGHRASDCIGCKQCERTCPQHLPITKYLGQCAEMLEK